MIQSIKIIKGVNKSWIQVLAFQAVAILILIALSSFFSFCGNRYDNRK